MGAAALAERFPVLAADVADDVHSSTNRLTSVSESVFSRCICMKIHFVCEQFVYSCAELSPKQKSERNRMDLVP